MNYTEYKLLKPKPEPPRYHYRWFDNSWWRLLRKNVGFMDRNNARAQAARDAKKVEASS